MELNAQTVKGFRLSDELLDPLMSLGALAPAIKSTFSLLSSFPPRPYRSCLWVRDVDGAAADGLDGFLLGHTQENCSEEWKEGQMDIKRRVTPGTW